MKGCAQTVGAGAFLAASIILCALIGASVFIRSSLTWPSRPHDPQGRPRLSGWYISSGYGWRLSPSGNDIEFHDGIDLASSTGDCPFAERCEVVSMVDGVVSFIGWDDRDDPLGKGGGQMVSVVNGDGQIETIFAHLEPYRHYVRLEGRIDDPYGRYDEWSEYALIGDGELLPGPESVKVTIACGKDAPTFIMVEGGAMMTFVYDRPGKCQTSVEWSSRGGGWQGWIPDGATSVRWETPITGPRHRRIAEDVGVLFRAVLIPPPPPPTATPTSAPQANPNVSAFSMQDAARATPAAQATTPYEAANAVKRAQIGHPCRPEGEACEWIWTASEQRAYQRRTERSPFTASMGGIGGPLRTARAPRVSLPPPNETSERIIVSARVDGDMEAPAGGRRVIYFIISSDAFPLTLTLDHHAAIIVRDFSILHGSCAGSGGDRTCERRGDSVSVIGRVVVDVDENAPFGAQLPFTVIARTANGATAAAETMIIVRNERVTPQPWPPPAPTAAAPTPAYPPPLAGTPRPQPIPPGDRPGTAGACAAQPLVSVPWSRLPNGQAPKLAQSAAESWARVREETVRRSGKDPFVRIADALRAPEFRSSKPGVALYSWHMTGRAIDVDLGYPWHRVRQGAYWRLYVNNVDVTEIFERHGWNRIPDRSDSQEWWHYEFRERLSWPQAMRQVWPLERLINAFPEIPWATIGCAGADLPPGPPPVADMTERCFPTVPGFSGAVSTAPGCGPPVRLGDVVRQLTDRVGFVGRTGATTGWHLHVSVRITGMNGVSSTYVCSDVWLQGRTPPPDAICWTDTADPLDFLPLSNEGEGMVDGQPIQLAPPELASEYVLGERVPSGMYWSPNRIDGPYGGGSWGLIRDWRQGERQP